MSFQNKKRLYGITEEQFMSLVVSQEYKCAACGIDATGYETLLQIDHDHETNEIRGLLCAGCNTAAEWLNDNPLSADGLAKYLRKNGTGIFIPYKE